MINDFECFNVQIGEVGKGDLFIGFDGYQVDFFKVNVFWIGMDIVW